MDDLAVVLTVRLGSERLPEKALKRVENIPLVLWIVERLRRLSPNVVVATTTNPEDNKVADLCIAEKVPCYRGSSDDVVQRIDGAVAEYFPDARYVFRALGDCPFIEIDLVRRAVEVMKLQHTQAFLWHLAPDTWPVYGSREFPFSVSGWKQIVNCSTDTEREHTDQYFHRNRGAFTITYHEPPANVYFRPYRIEIDWIEDLQVIQAVAKEIGMLAPLRDVIRLLDTRPDIVSINKERIEKTGPLTSYDYALRRSWMKAMLGKPVMKWDNTLWSLPDKAMPIFCNSGQCFLGYGSSGILHKTDGDRIAGDAYVHCACGSGKYWKEARK